MAITRKRARVRATLRRFVDEFVDNDLLTYASAISFQFLSTIVPFVMFGIGLLGFLHLEEVWRDGIGPDLRPQVSGPAYAVMNDVVEKVLESRQVFWVTLGLLIALWEISGAMRAIMGAMNTIYGDATKRSWGRRMAVSTLLGLGVGACLLGAVAVVVLGPLLHGDDGALWDVAMFLLRWAVAGALLLTAVAIMLHWAPERHQPLHWVTFGSLLIMGGWIAMSLAFGVYLRDIADYNSIFGSLATVVVLIAYLYASAVIFLSGVQVDALVRRGR